MYIQLHNKKTILPLFLCMLLSVHHTNGMQQEQLKSMGLGIFFMIFGAGVYHGWLNIVKPIMFPKLTKLDIKPIYSKQDGELKYIVYQNPKTKEMLAHKAEQGIVMTQNDNSKNKYWIIHLDPNIGAHIRINLETGLSSDSNKFAD